MAEAIVDRQTRSSGAREAVANNPHLREYLQRRRDEVGRYPDFVVNLDYDVAHADEVDVLYPVGDPVFVHVHGDPDVGLDYVAIEPDVSDAVRERYGAIRDRFLEAAPEEPTPEKRDEIVPFLRTLFDKVVEVDDGETGLVHRLLEDEDTVTVADEETEILRYYLQRDIADHGRLEPIIRDPYIEDIHGIGLEPIRLVHKVFDLVETNIRFADPPELDGFLKTMSERIGRPVSDSNPIADGALPDGSRINIVYSDDVSPKGPSFTIRKFEETPLSITEIVDWGTMSPRIAAYLWLCLEYGQSVFYCGETASGKTTSLNASLKFVRPTQKVYSAEDTPEVQPPQPTWQRVVTREQGPDESRVEMFDLLKAALRSRPNYIVVGEIRGAEGNVAFQAMQTGHPVLSTFHAASVQKMIQRLSSDPINVTVSFMDNLNVALIQQAVYQDGRMLRRVLSVEEIEGYSEHEDGVVTRGVFRWDPNTDEHIFRGRNNSYVLEERIAQVAGYSDKREIYDELDKRAEIIETMIDQGILDYDDVKEVIWSYYREGEEGLPFRLR